MALEPDEARRRVCRLETIGRTTGLRRDIEMWFAADGDRVYLLSGGRDHAHWVRNLRVNPAVRLRFTDRWLNGRARVLDPGDPDDRHARELLAGKYQGWTPERPLSDWARTSLPVAIDLSK